MEWDVDELIADDVFRLSTPDGVKAWGVVHHGSDTDHRQVLSIAEVDLPTGRGDVLVIDPLPGGLAHDMVRANSGLTQGEVLTLLSGVRTALATMPAATASAGMAVQHRTRLTLSAIGLDSAGKPVLIPGITRVADGSARHLIGDFIYHAGHGTPWSCAMLPIEQALAHFDPAVRTVVGELMEDSAPAATGAGANTELDELSEVIDVLGRTTRPSPLPLLPSATDHDLAGALTARLRAVDDGHERTRGRPRESSTARLGGGRRWPRIPRPMLAAVLLTVLGVVVLTFSWPRATAPAEETRSAATVPGDAASVPGPQAPDSLPRGVSTPGPLAEDEAFAVVTDLCVQRAAALSAGDVTGLAILTVPDSAAAMADSLLDMNSFAHLELSITMTDMVLEDSVARAFTVGGRMVSAVGQDAEFAPKKVHMRVVFDEGTWKVADVVEG